MCVWGLQNAKAKQGGRAGEEGCRCVRCYKAQWALNKGKG